MSSTFGTEVEDVLDTLPIDPQVVRCGTGRITIDSIKVWISEGDAILTNLLRMNCGSIVNDEASLLAGRAAIKFYAASNALRKINNNLGADSFMRLWETERRVFAQKPREVAGAIPLDANVHSNVEVDPCRRKRFGKKNFEW